MTIFQSFAWGYLQRFNVESPDSHNLRKKDCLVKKLRDVTLLNFQAHLYKPRGHFVTKRQTPSLDILAASKIRAHTYIKIM